MVFRPMISFKYYYIQFHIFNPTAASRVRIIQLPLVLLENITRMVTSDSGEYIYAMTPSRVSLIKAAEFDYWSKLYS